MTHRGIHSEVQAEVQEEIQTDIPADTVYADFHIHIGRSHGRPVKMAAAPSLTLENVIDHARTSKGLDIITIIDAVCTNVLVDLQHMASEGSLVAQPGGGYRHENGLVIFLGSEVEIRGPFGGAAHFGCWFGHLDGAKDFSDWLGTVQKNVSLSSQVARVDALTLQDAVLEREGMFIVHHAFTPHKGLYGNCVPHLHDMVRPNKVDALELGLSADTDMADCLSELSDVTFISNSDAHSLPKIAREYNALTLQHRSFEDVRQAFHRRNGQSVAANFGLQPELGKYHRTRCAKCGNPWGDEAVECSCGSTRTVPGVFDRLMEIRDRVEPIHPPGRPPYVPQVPLEYVPGLGPKTMKRLLGALGTEMAILHKASVAELSNVVGEVLAQRIDRARRGDVTFVEGGGGVYGHIEY